MKSRPHSEIQRESKPRAPLKVAAKSLLAQLTELRAKRPIGVWPRAEEGKHFFYVTLQPGADLARLLPQVDGVG